MSRLTKKEKETQAQEARETIHNIILAHPDGILLIDWMSGNATPTGRVDRYRVRYVVPQTETSSGFDVFQLTHLLSKAYGMRVNNEGHLLISGGGFCKENELADRVCIIAGVKRIPVNSSRGTMVHERG